VRLIVPGWPARLSQKWLTRISIRDKEHDGPGMDGTSYRVAIKPMVPGDKRTRRTSAILNRCRCARSSPIRRTAQSSRPARRR
jgi:DMSO/TMAO reductase YedYZ molybdopterin-dependent catalytic subunit